MKPQLALSLLIGKLIFYLTRWLNIGGGSAAPGYYALKIYPQLVVELGNKIPKTVVITGTNGKTTTAKMLAHFAKASGLQVIRNHTGSNLERGIASTLIQSAGVKLFHLEGGLRWHLPFDLGIWELDEFAFNTVTPKINPQAVVFLNVFRDQLDRYGEVDTVVKNWCQTLKNLPKETVVLVNGDDANTAKLAGYFRGKTFSFGVKDYKIVGESLKHKKEQQNLDYEAKNVRLNHLKSSEFQLDVGNCLPTGPLRSPRFGEAGSKASKAGKLEINLPLPGVYHIYDFLAAFAAGTKLGLSSEIMAKSLKNYSPAFGRVERLDFGYIFLIKNPAAATQIFETIAPQIKSQDRLLIALNDNLADGTDVSWIWDANFEELQNLSSERKLRGLEIYLSGTRAQDLAVRLKYAGFNPKSLHIDSNLKKALGWAKNGLKGRLFILPTYTALLKLQMILADSGVKSHYWKEG